MQKRIGVILAQAVLTTAIVFLSTQNAAALTGVELWRACQDKSKTSAAGLVCTVYARGFIDGFVGATVLGKINMKTCPPSAGVSADQSRLIIEKYLQENPQQLHREAGLLAMSAMMEAFPCQ